MKTKISWASAPPVLTLQPGAVHLWAFDYDCFADDLPAKIALLSPDEQARMSRFMRPEDQARFAVCHVALRLLLGRYLGIPPHFISFEKNEHGKPALLSTPSGNPLHFNLSHTSGLGIIAIAQGLTVGVDIEKIRPVERDIAQRYFSAREQADLQDLQGEEWLHAFFRCWTRKEAILKAEGVGLSGQLDAFDVSLRPEAPAAVLSVRAAAAFTAEWQLAELNPASGFIGALATSSVPAEIFRYRL